MRRFRDQRVPVAPLLAPWGTFGLVMSAGLLSLLISPGWYQDVMQEPELMYLHGPTAAYVLACVVIFGLSAWLAHLYVAPVLNRNAQFSTATRRDWVTARLMLILSSVLLLTLLGYLISALGLGEVVSSRSTDTEATRRAVAEQIGAVNLGWVPTFVVASLVWAVWSLPRRRPWAAVWLLFPIVLYAATTAVTLTRTTLIELAIPLAAVYIRRSAHGRTISRRWLTRASGIVVLIGVLLVAAVTAARGQGASSETVRSLVGYGPASFNRLTAVYEGYLTYPNSGSGYYALQGLWDAPVLGGVLRSQAVKIGLDVPVDAYANWAGQFTAVRAAGLQQEYIWGTQPGYILSDLGLTGSLVWHALFGVFTGVMYALFRRGNLAGIVIYPFLLAALFQAWSIPRGNQSTLLVFVLATLLIAAVRAVSGVTVWRRHRAYE